MRDESGSASWKRARLLSLDLLNIAIIICVITTAAFAINRIGEAWKAFETPANWTSCKARILSVSKQLESGKGGRYHVIVRMRTHDGTDVEDSYPPIRKKIALEWMSDLQKAGTVTVYRNLHAKDHTTEYALSPSYYAQKLYMPSFLMWWIGTLVGLLCTVLLWRYMRERIDFAAITRDRLYATNRSR